MAAEQVDAIASRDPVQIALLVELARTPEGRSDSGAMQRLLSIRPDLDVHAPAFRSRYLDPLAGAGLIEIAAGRRGAGATVFSITELGRSEAVQDLLDRFDVDGALGYRSSDLLRPTNEIVAELDSEDRHRRGIALEHLALRMLDWIGLSDLRWRVRPGANAEEIDGTANAKLPAFARWQVQAKNTSRLDADDAAKEVGLAVTNGAAVVMLITTGSFTAAARDIVERAERRGGLAIVCLDGEDVQEIADEPARLREKLARESARVHARH
jgi:site-specific DNA-methyltransferase (cytosine-N4-specific)